MLKVVCTAYDISNCFRSWSVVEYQDAEDLAFPIDPAKLPKKLELELTEDLLEYLKRQSQQMDRSIDEVIMQMLNDRIVQEGLGK